MEMGKWANPIPEQEKCWAGHTLNSDRSCADCSWIFELGSSSSTNSTNGVLYQNPTSPFTTQWQTTSGSSSFATGSSSSSGEQNASMVLGEWYNIMPSMAGEMPEQGMEERLIAAGNAYIAAEENFNQLNEQAIAVTIQAGIAAKEVQSKAEGSNHLGWRTSAVTSLGKTGDKSL